MKARIVKNNLLACIMAVLLTAIICFAAYAYTFAETMAQQAQAQCYLLKNICETDKTNIVKRLNEIKKSFEGRVTLVDLEGRVIFDSSYDEFVLENHKERKEIIDAVNLGVGSGSRYSKTEAKVNYYYAIRIDGLGVIRVGVSSSRAALMAVVPYMPIIIFAIIMVLIFVIWVSSATTKRIVYSIENFNFEDDNMGIYDELSPFIKRINTQNNLIATQSKKANEEKEKLERVFSNMKESIIVCDSLKNIVQVNNEAVRVFSAEINQSFSAALRSPQLDKDMQKALDGNTTHGVAEYNCRSYQYTISPNLMQENLTGAIMIALDITEQLEGQKMRREFTANVTHELKTPLTSILGYSQLISAGIAKAQDVQSFAAVIEKNAKQLLALIDDIMQISALEEEKKLEKQVVKLNNILEEIISDLMPVLEEKGIVLTKSLTPITILADIKQLQDLYRNLISNAIKYNKINGSVDVLLYRIDNNAIVKVADSGIGVAPSDKEKIFERFYVVDKARNKNISSTGLGLSIAKHIVEGMGGKITLDSRLGKGSCFTVSLPIE